MKEGNRSAYEETYAKSGHQPNCGGIGDFDLRNRTGTDAKRQIIRIYHPLRCEAGAGVGAPAASYFGHDPERSVGGYRVVVMITAGELDKQVDLVFRTVNHFSGI